MYEFMGGGMGGYMGIFWIVPLVLVIWLSMVLLDGKKEQGKTALNVLKERYAKGEIDHQEFEKMRQDLDV